MKEKQILKELKSKSNELDLSRDEDLSIAVMNLISIEEHLYFTLNKTNNEKYAELLKQIRELRASLMKQLLRNPIGEEWCISKHLLASSMRLFEVGNKYLTTDKEKANEMFRQSFELYSMFWGLNLDIIEGEKMATELEKNKKVKGITISSKEDEDPERKQSKLSLIIQKIVDCCKET